MAWDQDFPAPAEIDPELLAAGRAAAARHGFPVAATRHHVVPPAVRRVRLAHAAAVTRRNIADIQQSLLDDDPAVRGLARKTATELMRNLHIGDEDENGPSDSQSTRLSRVLNYVLSRVDRDSPSPWWLQARQQRRVRFMLNTAVLVLAAATSAAIASSRMELALVGLAAVVALQWLETAYTRLVRNRNIDQRWFACVTRQVSDTSMLTAIAISMALIQRPLVAAGMVFAVLLAVTGSFLRVSALQAGHRLWLSARTRVARWSAITVVCVGGLAAPQDATPVVIAAILVGLSGSWEMVRTIRAVLASNRTENATVVVLDADDHVWTFAARDSADWDSAEQPNAHSMKPDRDSAHL